MPNDREPDAAAACNSAHQLRELVQRAQRGDVSALPELRMMLDACPEIWHSVGDLAARSRLTWLNMIAGSDLFTREALERRLVEMQAELAGPDPSLLERHLVDRILTCSLQVHYMDMLLTKTHFQSDSELQELLNRQRAADRRHQVAIKHLATIRKLLPDAVRTKKLKLHDPTATASSIDAEADPLLRERIERERATGLPKASPESNGPYLDMLLHRLVEDREKAGSLTVIPPPSVEPYSDPLLQGLIEERERAAAASQAAGKAAEPRTA